MPNFITIDALFCRNQGLFNDQSDFNNNNNNNIAHFYRAPLCQSHRGASATAKVYNVTYTARDRITPKLCTYRQWGVCVCVISFTTIRPWALISLLSQLDAAAPESSYPLGDKPVNQPALIML